MPIQSTKLPLLREEYTRLFETCIIRPEHVTAVASLVKTILSNEPRYLSVANETSVPWFVIAVIHSMECSLGFDKHLHNGDLLTKRTWRVPAGRPISGTPPFTWEKSAIDALDYDGLTKWKNWSLPGTLYKLEAYNGFGTRKRQINTPYLWSFSFHYDRGKFVNDGEFNPNAISKQCGAAVLLRRMAELGEIGFIDQTPPSPGGPSVGPVRTKQSQNVALTVAAEQLQIWLNTHPGIFVKVDGVPGPKTSKAYFAVTGHRLPGDPLS